MYLCVCLCVCVPMQKTYAYICFTALLRVHVWVCAYCYVHLHLCFKSPKQNCIQKTSVDQHAITFLSLHLDGYPTILQVRLKENERLSASCLCNGVRGARASAPLPSIFPDAPLCLRHGQMIKLPTLRGKMNEAKGISLDKSTEY